MGVVLVFLHAGLIWVGVRSGRLFHEDMKCIQEVRVWSGLHLGIVWTLHSRILGLKVGLRR